MRGRFGGVVVAVLAAAVCAMPAAAQVTERSGDRPVAGLLRPGGAEIGVSIRDLRDEDVAQADLPSVRGVRIESIRDAGPAARAGFEVGDIVVEFDGTPIRSARAFARLVDETPAGRRVEAVVLRGDTRLTLHVTPEPGPGVVGRLLPELTREIERGMRRLPEFEFPRAVVLARPGWLGASLLPLDPQLADYFGVAAGALVSSVEEGTPAAEAGMRAGDVIVRLGDQEVAGVADVARALRTVQEGAAVTVGIVRDRAPLSLTATLPARPRPAARRVPG